MQYTGTGSGTTITGLTDGIHNFTVTNDAGCISPVSAEILITAFPGAPVAPTIGINNSANLHRTNRKRRTKRFT